MAVAIVSALMGAHCGLVGLIYGISLGWAIRTLVSAAIAGPHLLHG